MTPIRQIVRRTLPTQTATIANAGTTSSVINLTGAAFGGVVMPAAITGTTMTFTVCTTSGGTYVPLTDSVGNAISQTIAASKGFALPPEAFAFPYLKLVSGSAEGGARSIEVTTGA